MAQPNLLDNPIPGENYTSDTRSYPWHRPPDLIDYDEIVDYAITKISSEDNLHKVYALLGAGMDMATLVSIMQLQNISQGKYSVDMALLTAGPIARMLQILVEKNGTSVDMGIENDNEPITKDDILMMAGLLDSEGEKIDEEEILAKSEEPVSSIPSGGLMGVPEDVELTNETEQADMLGYNSEEEEEVV